MAHQSTLLIHRDNLSQTIIAPADLPELQQGQARIALGRFSLSANNVTYGVFGKAMGYWDFFPPPVAQDGFGYVPVWGFGQVVESQAEGLALGTRVYGYFPMAPFLDVDVTKASPHGFVDGAAHRQPMAGIYNRYEVVAALDDETEGRVALLKPLFITGFLLDEWISSENAWGADTIIASSASSKTALAMAACFKKRGKNRIIGLTSQRSADFVEASGYYDQVVTYEEIDTLNLTASVYVDFAGDGAITHRVHERLDNALKASIIVGGSHWDAGASAGSPLKGPKPEFFFAPTHVGRLSGAWGGLAFAQAVNGALDRFVHDSRGWLALHEISGLEAAQNAWARLLANEVNANQGIVVSF